MRSKKIVFIGAGSTVFALTLLNDLCAIKTLDAGEIVLFDIDDRRLQTTLTVAKRLLSKNTDEKSHKLSARATLDRDDALRDADFVLVMFQIGGYRPATVIDFEIPKRYGLRQTIGDTLGIGGIMRGLRSIPVLRELADDMHRLCPQALLINYANPMAINCWGLADTGIRFIGLCHSVPHTNHELAEDLGIPHTELQYLVAGINHLAFYLKLERDGEDLYPKLRAFMETGLNNTSESDPPGRFPPRRHWVKGKAMVDHLRYELMNRTGYFVTESSEHLAEYLPYFIKRTAPELLERYRIPLDEYPRRCEEQIAEWEELEQRLLKGVENDEGMENTDASGLSDDYGMRIVDSISNNTVRRVYANVCNDGIISNLPARAIVEVPCLVDGNGVQPTRIGALPPQLAALMRSNINVQELTARAAIEKRRDYVYHAAMLDPHTAAELTIDQIKAMVDELLEAHRDCIDVS